MMNTEQFLYYNQLSYINAGREWPGRPEPEEVIPNTDWQKAIFEIGQSNRCESCPHQGAVPIQIT